MPFLLVAGLKEQHGLSRRADKRKECFYMFKNYLIPNIQLFAEEGQSTEGQNTDGQGTQENTGGQGQQQERQKDTPKTFTEADIERIINKKYAQWQKEKEREIAEARSEAEKLAKMTAEQKAEHERKKAEEDLKRREAEITRRELRAQALETLAEKKLPSSLIEAVVLSDADSCNDSINAIETAFREAVEAAVNERLKGNPPAKGGTSASKSIDDEIRAALFGK